MSPPLISVARCVVYSPSRGAQRPSPVSLAVLIDWHAWHSICRFHNLSRDTPHVVRGSCGLAGLRAANQTSERAVCAQDGKSSALHDGRVAKGRAVNHALRWGQVQLFDRSSLNFYSPPTFNLQKAAWGTCAHRQVGMRHALLCAFLCHPHCAFVLYCACVAMPLRDLCQARTNSCVCVCVMARLMGRVQMLELHSQVQFSVARTYP
jgi:hypothetical protein